MQSVVFVAAGKVQGVNFRRATKQVADELCLQGFIRNSECGGYVSGEATGSAEVLQRFEAFLHRGPARARVSAVYCAPVEVSTKRRGFQILPTQPMDSLLKTAVSEITKF